MQRCREDGGRDGRRVGGIDRGIDGAGVREATAPKMPLIYSSVDQ